MCKISQKCCICFRIIFRDFNFMFTACRTQQLTMPLCATLLCSSQIHPVATSFQTWPSFAKNSGQLSLWAWEPFTIASTENHKTDLLCLLFALMQDWSIIHHAAEPARDRGLFSGLEMMMEGNLQFTCWNFRSFIFALPACFWKTWKFCTTWNFPAMRYQPAVYRCSSHSSKIFSWVWWI